MASPMLEGRSPRALDPHKKSHFSLHISDRIAKGDASQGSYSAVKYNHKPAQASLSRTSTLTSAPDKQFNLTLEDGDEEGDHDADVFRFTGQRTTPKRSYILIFDPLKQSATLERLSAAYTFNLQSKNNKNIAQEHAKIYPQRQKDDGQGADEEDLFADTGQDENAEPDPDNPYDFRHFMNKDGEKRGDESDYRFQSSPDSRTGTGSAINTPLMPARKPATAAAKARAAAPARKRKSPEPEALASRNATTKKQAPPTVRLDRRASTRVPEPKPDPVLPTKASRKPTGKAASKPPPKSAEIVHDSDESDVDAEGEPVSSAAPSPPKPVYADEEEDDYEEDNMGGGLEIEVPDERPTQKPRHGALASLGLGSQLGLGGLGHLRSPSNGPISLASAANSVEGTPNPHAFTPRDKSKDEEVIDFGDLGGRGNESDEDEDGYAEDEEMDDRDVEPMDIGPPAAQTQSAAAEPPTRKMSVGGMGMDVDEEEEEEDPFEKELMEGLAGGESSEESEEE